MKLKHIILDIIDRDTLKSIADELQLEDIDRRSAAVMGAKLSRSHRATARLLLRYLSEKQVKTACDELGVSSAGRRKVLVRRLLAQKRARISKPQAREQTRSASTKKSHASRPPRESKTMSDSTPASTEAQETEAPARLPDPPAGMVRVTKTELVWPGKYTEDGRLREVPRVSLPFQVIETVNESRATREAQKGGVQGTLFDVYEGKEGDTFEAGWRNKLIWGDNLLVMGSLMEKFAGKIDLIYVDPPFDTGADFSFRTMVGGDDDPVPGKEPSIIEEKAYRDTWGDGYTSYLQMIRDRLVLLRDLLAETGSIFVHLDAHTGPYVKCLMDEIFGQDNFQNEIAWYYYNKLHDSRKRRLPKAFDQILYYVKNRGAPYLYSALKEPRDKPVTKLKYRKVAGKIQNIIGEDGKAVTYESTERTVDNVWRIRCLQPANKAEWVHFQTQKPVDLIERVIQVGGKVGGLFLDAFAGSGSSLVAAERQRMRWIGVDISRWSNHLTRKRLLDEDNCKPFEVLNLGKYERQYWQGADVWRSERQVADRAGALRVPSFHPQALRRSAGGWNGDLHGKKGKAMVHIGAVDAPVTITEIDAAADECAKLKQSELHVLGWEWEMGLYDLVVDAAKKKGVKLLLLHHSARGNGAAGRRQGRRALLRAGLPGGRN